ncbi:hypothetical protein D3C80_1748890 [compost metagenome]
MGRVPGRVGTTNGADLGDDDQILGVRVQRFADQLVGDMGSVEISGVDVVDPARQCFAQHGDGGRRIFGRSEDLGPRQLHRAVAHAIDRAIAQ